MISYSHFTGEETKAQRGEGYAQSHSEFKAESTHKPRSLQGKACAPPSRYTRGSQLRVTLPTSCPGTFPNVRRKFLVVMTPGLGVRGRVCPMGILRIVRDAASMLNSPQGTGQPPQQRIIWSKVSIGPELRTLLQTVSQVPQARNDLYVCGIF